MGKVVGNALEQAVGMIIAEIRDQVLSLVKQKVAELIATVGTSAIATNTACAACVTIIGCGACVEIGRAHV
jgi:hypothetical protein